MAGVLRTVWDEEKELAKYNVEECEWLIKHKQMSRVPIHFFCVRLGYSIGKGNKDGKLSLFNDYVKKFHIATIDPPKNFKWNGIYKNLPTQLPTPKSITSNIIPQDVPSADDISNAMKIKMCSILKSPRVSDTENETLKIITDFLAKQSATKSRTKK